MTDKTIAPLVKSVPVVTPEDTVRRAAGLIRSSDGSRLVVVDYGQIAGTVSEQSISAFLGAAEDPEKALDEPIRPLLSGNAVLVNSCATLKEAAHLFGSTDADVLPVINNGGAFQGVVYRRDVVGLLSRNLRPPNVAGMATPLGVYLTTGSHTGGAGNLGLVLTGASLALMMVMAALFVEGLMRLFGVLTGIPISLFLQSTPLTIKPNIYDLAFYISTILTVAVMLLLLRLSPLSGYHAAEHMTVHAIEAGEAIAADTVRRMPRVHPRCGTNLLAAAGVFLIIVSRFSGEVAVLLALVVVVLGWRSIGGWLQYLVTTKPPNEQQLANGVAAGKQLLERFQERPNYQLTGLDRIWRMGLLQTAAGLIVGLSLLTYLLSLVNLNLLLL